MQKKFKFKLEGLLKLRKFKEYNVKVELGALLVEIEKSKNAVVKIKEEIKNAFHEQEEFCKEGFDGSMLRFYSFYIRGKEEDIKNKKNLIEVLNKKYENKLLELQKCMAERDVISSMKEKHKQEHRKIIDKKLQEDRDEIIQIQRSYRKRIALEKV